MVKGGSVPWRRGVETFPTLEKAATWMTSQAFVGIDLHRQVREARVGRDVGDVAGPDLVGEAVTVNCRSSVFGAARGRSRRRAESALDLAWQSPARIRGS